MNGEEPRDYFSAKVLLRYKLLISTVAAVIIFGGYLRIITQDRSYSATARMKVRFSEELLQVPEVQSGSVRVPVLEEEVKAYVVLMMDPGFIDLVLRDLDEASKNAQEEAPAVEKEEPSAVEVLLQQGMDFINEARHTMYSFLDSVLFVKDTVVSVRERRVLSVLSHLDVQAGTDASHVITVTYTSSNPTWAAAVANAVTYKFIEVQKQKTRRKDLAKLEQDVEDAKELLRDVIRRKYELSQQLRATSIPMAIQAQYDKLEALGHQEEVIRTGLKLLDAGIIPTDKDLPINVTQSGLVERLFMETEMQALKDGTRLDRFEHLQQVEKGVREFIERQKSRQSKSIRAQLTARLQSIDEERLALQQDTSIIKLSPDYSALEVEETTAHGRLNRVAEELVQGQRFNQQLDQEYVAQNVSLFQPAKAPPFPDPQRRLLRIIVVAILGVVAGLGTAVLRHMIWPKQQRTSVITASGEEVDVPVVILPEEDDDGLESDIEFDMTFPEEGDFPTTTPRKRADPGI